jgi:uncharacterized protein (DUF342 family)
MSEKQKNTIPDQPTPGDPEKGDENNNKTPGEIEILLSDDGYQCWLRLTKTETGALPEKSDVLNIIEKQKLSTDLINEEEFNRVFEELVSDEKVLIAEGTPKKDGKDGFFTYLFKTTMSEFLQENEQGQIDYQQICFVQQKEAGEAVAELTAPEKGVDGLTVTGEVIKAIDGKPAQMPSGINVQISEEKPQQLVSSIDGSVSLKGNKIIVDPVVVVEGDVDYSSGNIDYKGSVIIEKGIKAGFSVKSGGDVVVSEIVDDAVINAGGNVVLQGGFKGRGTGRINAKGEVVLTFAENQVIIAGGNITVSDAILHCNIESDESVVVLGAKGIIGGATVAVKSIEVQSAGSQAATETVLSIGSNREIRTNMERFRKELENHEKNSLKIQKAIIVLNKINLIKRGLPEKQKALYTSLMNTQKQLNKEYENLLKSKKELDEKADIVEHATITVHQRIYPNVKILFGNKLKVVQEHGIGVVFALKDDEINVKKITG